MNYAEALSALKRGEIVARLGWWGIGLYLRMPAPADSLEIRLFETFDESDKIWHANVADENATDWMMLEGEPQP